MALNPLISICLPVFNGEDYLASALESILNQSERNFELLVADDCSSDGSFAIAEKFARLDRRVKAWRNHERRGLFENYNQCLLNSRGKYIKPMAQDDLLLPDMLSKCVEVLEARPQVALVSTRRRFIDERGNEIEPVCIHIGPEAWLGEGDSYIYAGADVTAASINPLQNLVGEPCTVMFRSEYAGRGFSSRLRHFGDFEYWLRILQNGDFAYIPETLVAFRQHGLSASSHNLQQLLIASDVIHFAEENLELLSRFGYSEGDFIRSNLSAMSVSISNLVEAGALTGIASGESHDQNSDESGLRKALFYSMMLLSSDADLYRSLSRQKSEIALSEEKLRLLLNSFPWRATRLLREVNRRLDPGGSRTESEDYVVLDNPQYLSYLRQKRKTILLSRSWKLGRSIQMLAANVGMG